MTAGDLGRSQSSANLLVVKSADWPATGATYGVYLLAHRLRSTRAVLDVASFRPNFIDYYPMSGWVRGEIAVYAGGGSNAHLTSFVLYEFACLHNPEFLIRATAELWYVSLGQSGRQRRGTRRR